MVSAYRVLSGYCKLRTRTVYNNYGAVRSNFCSVSCHPDDASLYSGRNMLQQNFATCKVLRLMAIALTSVHQHWRRHQSRSASCELRSNRRPVLQAPVPERRLNTGGLPYCTAATSSISGTERNYKALNNIRN